MRCYGSYVDMFLDNSNDCFVFNAEFAFSAESLIDAGKIMERHVCERLQKNKQIECKDLLFYVIPNDDKEWDPIAPMFDVKNYPKYARLNGRWQEDFK